ncbi:ATP-binding protein [Pseudomonas syringae]|uniref:ATP-binding protein n=1 Tax=Pseudomonas syringae TaxID=317 RepID=UPI000D956F84|nr:AAA family ATPase [Pseudomonas syringae pv. maculicola]
MFKKAERKQARLRLALAGPSGSGKTLSALLLATGLGGKIAVIDTEHDSASLYADYAEFDVMSLSAPYSPERYIEAITSAEESGYSVLIIDSYSHEWIGAGGCLEINDSIAKQKYKGNTWSAWNETTPRHRRLVDRILTSPLHIICTMRSKTETVQGEGKKIIKLGMKSEQRDGSDYEFTVVLDLVHDGNVAIATKDRTRIFDQPEVISADTGRRLMAWLNDGAKQDAHGADAVDEAISKIPLSETIQELQSIYSAAYRMAECMPEHLSRLNAAKDKRKSELMKVA